jgi:hypothetical protein
VQAMDWKGANDNFVRDRRSAHHCVSKALSPRPILQQQHVGPQVEAGRRQSAFVCVCTLKTELLRQIKSVTQLESSEAKWVELQAIDCMFLLAACT